MIDGDEVYLGQQEPPPWLSHTLLFYSIGVLCGIVFACISHDAFTLHLRNHVWLNNGLPIFFFTVFREKKKSNGKSGNVGEVLFSFMFE